MKVLCLGFSSIVKRRVLPALVGLEGIEAVELASRRGAPEPDEVPDGVLCWPSGFDDALERSNADCVYVSTVNSEHATWTRRALAAGFHVAVDKPAVLSRSEAEELVAYSRARNLVLGEATVYAAHPQVDLCKQILDRAGTRPSRISAIFSIPPLDENNFRYRRSLGGGALWDLGPYAVSLGRVFFGAEPSRLDCAVNSRGGPDAVDTAFSMLARYPEGRTVVGHFGFDTEYRNELTVLGDSIALAVTRFFTTSRDAENEITVHERNAMRIHSAPAADSFACFLSGFSRACEDPAGSRASRLADDLLTDARALDALRRSAEE